jgi:hypothetical protein
MTQDRFGEALEFLRRGHELGTKQPRWNNPSALWIAQAEQLDALGPRLGAIVRGEDVPANGNEAQVVVIHYYRKKRFALSARVYAKYCETTLAKDRDHVAGTFAISSAIQAGCGQGADSASLTAAERAELRRLALGWLRTGLALRQSQLAGDNPNIREIARDWLIGYQTRPEYAGVRDAAELAKLPAAERAEWDQFWADVRAALAKAPPPAPKKK